MADLYVKAPKTSTVVNDVTYRNTSVGTVLGISFINNGFNVADTEGLVRILNPSPSKKTKILALTDVTELKQEQWEAEKPNYPN